MAMAPRFFQVLPFFGCTHQFSWPRRWRDGEYYQVCLRCGAEYQYDWVSMQRRERVERHPEPASRMPQCDVSSWRPRARRLAVDLPVQFRQGGCKEWHDGVIRNLSKTGLLIVAQRLLPARAQVELKFVMPKEISGQDHSLVLTSGMVARVLPNENGKGGRMAATIQACRFLRQ